jgi:N-acyl-D-amino-acid deacylase
LQKVSSLLKYFLKKMAGQIKTINSALIDCLVFDGTGSKPFRSNIGIAGDKIVAITKRSDILRGAKSVIDANGLAVSPGFIDTHGHSEFTLLADPRAEGKLAQGITTEINGNCGLSAAPLTGEAWEQRQEDFRELGISERLFATKVKHLSRFKNYFEILSTDIAINYATLVGHGNIRGCVMGFENRKPKKRELAKMISLLMNALKEGALGFSTGLAYPPCIYSDTEELVEFCRALSGLKYKKRDRHNDMNRVPIFTAHMRNEGDTLIESVEEMILIGKETGIRVHISHIKTSGKHNWSKIDKVLSVIEKARDEGISITCDRYPYIASSTDLDVLLPSWVYVGGMKDELKRLRNVETRNRIKKEITRDYPGKRFWDHGKVATVHSEKNKWTEGKSIAFVSRQKNSHPVDFFIKLLIEEELRVSAIFAIMNEDNLKRFISLPYVMIGSDSAARSIDGITCRGKPHPRGFGTFTRFLGKYVRGHGLMDLTTAIHKATMLPAQTFGIAKRGIIKKGAFADLVVFDHTTIIDKATFEKPFLKPAGIHHVIVNGVPAIRGGKATGNYGGRILRHGK